MAALADTTKNSARRCSWKCAFRTDRSARRCDSVGAWLLRIVLREYDQPATSKEPPRSKMARNLGSARCTAHQELVVGRIANGRKASRPSSGPLEMRLDIDMRVDLESESLMNINRNLALACIATITALCGDLLLLLVGNSLRTGMRLQQPSMIVLTMGGLLGCLSIPLAYAFGYAVMARVLRPTARITAAVILFGGIGLAIVGGVIHGVTWMIIRSSMIAGAVSSSSPMAAIMKQGGILLNLWIIGCVLLTVLSILIARSGVLRPRAIPLWLAFLNPITLILLIGILSPFTDIGRSYILPMAPNLAHIGFFLALFWCLHSGRVRQPD